MYYCSRICARNPGESDGLILQEVTDFRDNVKRYRTPLERWQVPLAQPQFTMSGQSFDIDATEAMLATRTIT